MIEKWESWGRYCDRDTPTTIWVTKQPYEFSRKEQLELADIVLNNKSYGGYEFERVGLLEEVGNAWNHSYRTPAGLRDWAQSLTEWLPEFEKVCGGNLFTSP